MTLLISEQNVRWKAKFADHGYIPEKGEICYQWQTDELIAGNDAFQKCLGISLKN